MRFSYFGVCLAVLCTFAGMAATTATKTTAAKKAGVGKKSATKTTAKTHTGTARKATGKATLAKGKAAKKQPPAATWRTRQQAPTPERYKEIQQALVDKGYLKGDPSGVWDADSSSAMQRFQMDQKLTPSGKVNAPSLIGLGLGAKSAGAPEAAPLKSAPSGPDGAAAGPPVPSTSAPQ